MTFKREMKLFWAMIFGLWLSHFCIYNFIGPGVAGLFLFPIILAFALRVVFTPIFAYHFVLVLTIILNLISEVKFFYSQKVLSVQDLMYMNQAADVHDFLPIPTLLVIVVALSTLFIPYKKFNFSWKAIPVAGLMIFAHFAYAGDIKTAAVMNAFLNKYADIRLSLYNLRDNVRGNGILLHLTQTLAMSAKPEKGPHNFYAETKTTSDSIALAKAIKGYDIFLINWESGYFDQNSNSPLHNDFKRLIESGYQITSMISPVYGGNTSEAEFELMTGMPAKGLPGIKFQLYGSSFSEEASTLPKYAKNFGYRSYYYHNTPKVHWNRDVALPKFNFEKVFFVEDMNTAFDMDTWVRDYFLYNKVLSQYKESIKSPGPVFNHIMNVYSHGFYTEKDGDGGLADFNSKISISMDDYFKFEQEAIETAKLAGRKAVFFIVGDHKPSLNKTYFQTKTVSPTHYIAMSDAATKNDFRFKENLNSQGLLEIGRVPFFIKIFDGKKMDNSLLIKPLADKPLFCFPAFLFNENKEPASSYFVRLRGVCEEASPQTLINPDWQRSIFPPELFAEQLFE